MGSNFHRSSVASITSQSKSTIHAQMVYISFFHTNIGTWQPFLVVWVCIMGFKEQKFDYSLITKPQTTCDDQVSVSKTALFQFSHILIPFQYGTNYNSTTIIMSHHLTTEQPTITSPLQQVQVNTNVFPLQSLHITTHSRFTKIKNPLSAPIWSLSLHCNPCQDIPLGYNFIIILSIVFPKTKLNLKKSL